MNALPTILIAMVVLTLVLGRQLRPLPVREDQPYRVMVTLALLGGWQVAKYVDGARVPDDAWMLLAASLVISAGLGFVRGTLTPVWQEKGTLMRQGNAMTVALWVVAIALAISVDPLIGQTSSTVGALGRVSLLLHLAVSLGAQTFATLLKAERLEGASGLA